MTTENEWYEKTIDNLFFELGMRDQQLKEMQREKIVMIKELEILKERYRSRWGSV